MADPGSGVTVGVKGDRPLVDASVWSINPVIAVEPFIRVDAQPGGEFRWRYTYTYSITIQAGLLHLSVERTGFDRGTVLYLHKDAVAAWSGEAVGKFDGCR